MRFGAVLFRINSKLEARAVIRRRVAILLGVIVVLGVGYFSLRSSVKRKHERARSEWKTRALLQLATLSITNKEISDDLAMLKADATPNFNWGWATDKVLRMTNGEYLIYAFYHGFNSGFIDHLFLGHGSDGRWYYSTYHFCNGMVAIRSDDPPGSIAQFAKTYAAWEFDGKSDECLKHTWPAKK
jgi:hypothetical protein